MIKANINPLGRMGESDTATCKEQQLAATRLSIANTQQTPHP